MISPGSRMLAVPPARHHLGDVAAIERIEEFDVVRLGDGELLVTEEHGVAIEERHGRGRRAVLRQRGRPSRFELIVHHRPLQRRYSRRRSRSLDQSQLKVALPVVSTFR